MTVVGDRGVDDRDAHDAKERAEPELADAGADVRARDVHDPVRGQRRDAQDNEERDDVVAVLVDLVRPFLQPAAELWDGE